LYTHKKVLFKEEYTTAISKIVYIKIKAEEVKPKGRHSLCSCLPFGFSLRLYFHAYTTYLSCVYTAL